MTENKLNVKEQENEEVKNEDNNQQIEMPSFVVDLKFEKDNTYELVDITMKNSGKNLTNSSLESEDVALILGEFIESRLASIELVSGLSEENETLQKEVEYLLNKVSKLEQSLETSLEGSKDE